VKQRSIEDCPVGVWEIKKRRWIGVASDEQSTPHAEIETPGKMFKDSIDSNVAYHPILLALLLERDCEVETVKRRSAGSSERGEGKLEGAEPKLINL